MGPNVDIHGKLGEGLRTLSALGFVSEGCRSFRFSASLLFEWSLLFPAQIGALYPRFDVGKLLSKRLTVSLPVLPAPKPIPWVDGAGIEQADARWYLLFGLGRCCPEWRNVPTLCRVLL